MANKRPAHTGGDARPQAGQRIQASGRARVAFNIASRQGMHGCHGRTKANARCPAYVVRDTDYCIGHTRANGNSTTN